MINKAINDKIKSEFKGIKLQSSDVEEGFERPSFFVSLETNETETFLFNRLRDITCRILFFPSDRYRFKEEAYNVQDRLELLFGLNIEVEDRTITLNSVNTDIIDKVVHFSFSFDFYEEIDQQEKQGDIMQELKYNE
ncbi:hypothetical protein ERL59_18985 [Chengkuizengella sp. YPA3-1-1]|uniref:Uncharacterized protein n=2 Tax=Chengkuizengella marina TaxID=2507566 RepID=A0A6N9Q838_9BACL|nr:hypothetical protein [Chengkuizengella marina]